ncbi:MAG TPA: flagellar basal body rod C-terminal domain-containing protein [Acidocella sp.]|nr:flagellar basal body rod C-terminal domain-containing protein [Acidocella sp.]
MSGIIGAINTALSGIEAFESGINTVSNNLANETVSGYAAESIDLTTQVDLANGSGYGVQSPVVLRAADGFAAGLLRTANTANQAAGTLATNLTNISSAVLNNGDIQTSMNQFFQDLGTLAANPSSAGARETVLSDANNVAGTFQTAATSLTTTMTDAGTALQENVSTANKLLSQLATINQGLQTSPNNPSLLDQQEAALSSLSNLLPVTVLTQSNGSIQLSLGGNVLLNQAGAETLSLSGGTATQEPVITVGDQPMPLSLTESDGQMGANMATWMAGSQALQGLNTMAAMFTGEVNTAQAEGLTYNGTQGTNLFAQSPAPTVTANTSNPNGTTLTATVSNPSQLPTSGGPIVLTFTTGKGWTASNQAGTTTYPVSMPSATSLSVAGMNITVSAAPANGDSYTIDPAPGAAAGMEVVTTNPDDIAAADPYVGTPGTLNATGTVTDNNSGTITTGTDSVTTTPPPAGTYVPSSDFGQPLTVVFTSSTGSSTPDGYAIYVGAPTNPPGTPVATGTLTSGNGSLSGTISVQYPNTTPTEYWQLPISGTPSTGDDLTLTPGGPTSGSNATRMAALWTTPNTAGSGTLQQAVIGFTTGLGANANEAMTQATGTAAQVASATTNLQNVAGVNSDQQAVLLVNYQQAYQAAAQVISTAHTMFQSLLSATAA